MQKYVKPALTYLQQLDLLKNRGLIVADEKTAFDFLSHVNYYRFSAYCIPFEKRRHEFKNGVHFSDIQKLYEFDRTLRFLIDEALEIIEISVRSNISYYMAHKYGPFAHENKNAFFCENKYFNYDEWLGGVHKEIERSKETFVKHYKNKYENFPVIPIWMAVEAMSFGNGSKIYRNILNEGRKEIAKKYCLRADILETWLHSFTFVRNICAHHGRIWNKEMAIAIEKPRNSFWEKIDSKKLGSIIFAIIQFLNVLPIDGKIIDAWKFDMEQLLDTEIKVDNFYEAMGLSKEYKSHDLWKLPYKL